MCSVCLLQSDMASSCLVLKSAMCKLIDPDLHSHTGQIYGWALDRSDVFSTEEKKVLLSFNVAHLENIVLLETVTFCNAV